MIKANSNATAKWKGKSKLPPDVHCSESQPSPTGDAIGQGNLNRRRETLQNRTPPQAMQSLVVQPSQEEASCARGVGERRRARSTTSPAAEAGHWSGRMEGRFSGHAGVGHISQAPTQEQFHFDLELSQEEMQQFCNTDLKLPPTSGNNRGHVRTTPVQSVQDHDLQEINSSQFVEDIENKKGVSHRGKAFKPQEDRVICSGWLNVSRDAVTGVGQTESAFYARLHRYYLENWDMSSNRTVLSIQNRWTTIRKCVSKFQAIISGIYRRNESGKNERDMINDAIRCYEQTEPWKFGHCWEMLRDEPKWNDYILECSMPKQSSQTQQLGGPSDTPTAPMHSGAPIDRPEGRDSAKRRRSKAPMEDTASSVAVEMLQKIHNRGQEMDELDAKHKEEILRVERAKLELQEKALTAKIHQGDKKIELQREMSLEQIKLKREMALEHIKLKRDMMEVSKLQTEVQIMFTDLNSCVPSMRYWIAKKQRDIMVKEGLNPDDLEAAPGASHDHHPSSGGN